MFWSRIVQSPAVEYRQVTSNFIIGWLSYNNLKTDFPCHVLGRPQLASNEGSFNRKSNIRINVTLRRVRVTIFVVENQ